MNGQREMRTFNYPNMVVRVHFPDLTEEERNRRNKQIYKAAVDVLKAAQGRGCKNGTEQQ